MLYRISATLTGLWRTKSYSQCTGRIRLRKATPRLADEWLITSVEYVADSLAHRAVHLIAINFAERHPAGLGGLAARCELPADRACGEHDRELLADLAVGGVQDDVSRVGVDPRQAADLALDATLLASLAGWRPGSGTHRSGPAPAREKRSPRPARSCPGRLPRSPLRGSCAHARPGSRPRTPPTGDCSPQADRLRS